MKRTVITSIISILAVLLLAVSCRGALSTEIELALTQTALAPFAATRVAAAQRSAEPPNWDDLLTITPTDAVAGVIGNPRVTRTPASTRPAGQAGTPLPTITYAPGQPTWTRTPVPGVTTTPAATETEEPTEPPEPSESPEPTQTPESGWEGEWLAYYGPENATVSGSLDITLNGDAIFAIANLDGATMILNGTLSSQGYVVGAYQYRGGTGNFYWQMVSGRQFAGSTSNDLAFCAARYTADKPQTCLQRSGFE